MKQNNNITNIYSFTKKGFWQPGIEKPNQDDLFIFTNITNPLNNYYYIGVCDGHGKFGKEVSSYISTNLLPFLNSNFLEKKINLNQSSFFSISKIITDTFIQMNLSLNTNPNIETSYSGSTCSSIIFTANRIISINLGDSRCILGKYNIKYNIWSYQVLTQDHKPNVEKEKDRIIKQGGKIFRGKDEFGNSVGIKRIWLNDEGDNGLALTRSFGDKILSNVGISCEPEIKEFYLKNEAKFIIIATDGLWEYISNKECVDIVKNFYLKKDAKGAINYLIKEASKRWINEQDIVDDITIILVFLD